MALRLASMHAFALLTLVLGGGLGNFGCGSAESQPGIICGRASKHCGTPVDISVVCGAGTEACTVDGVRFACSEGFCELEAGRQLVIDLTRSSIGEHQTSVWYDIPQPGSGSTPPVHFKLDGVDGVRSEGDPDVSFPGHRGPPETLGVSLGGGVGSKFATSITMSDAPCLEAVAANTPACQEIE